jgi:GNAT superfamily N-acetyltransferase
LELERLHVEERPQMLPLSLQEIAGHPMGLVAFYSEERQVAGYNAVLTEYPDQIIEIGGLYIPPQFRGRGFSYAIKSEMFRRVQERYPDHGLITFCNPESLKLNLDFGFRRAERAEIPEEAFVFCRTKCPIGKLGLELLQQQGKICCDQIMVHDPLGTPATHLTSPVPTSNEV